MTVVARTHKVGNASGSVCPKGWTLPSDGSWYSDYVKLGNRYGITGDKAGITKMQKAPFNFILNGYYDDDGRVQLLGINSFYWSGTAYDSIRAYAANIISNSVSIGYGVNGRSRGLALRCVAR